MRVKFSISLEVQREEEWGDLPPPSPLGCQLISCIFYEATFTNTVQSFSLPSSSLDFCELHLLGKYFRKMLNLLRVATISTFDLYLSAFCCFQIAHTRNFDLIPP